MSYDAKVIEDTASANEPRDNQVSEVSGEADGKITDKLKKNIIRAFREYPLLWNTSLAEYKDKVKKVEASKTLASRFNLLVEELKKCLSSLRTSMVRELKRCQECETYVSSSSRQWSI